MNEMIKASAPGNLFFLGEHAVVYDQPCIITSVNKRTTVTLEPRDDNKVLIASDAFGKASAEIENGFLKNRMMETDELNITLKLCENLIGNLRIEEGFSLHIQSEIPVKSGMSSSTALLSALLGAISKKAGEKISKDYYWEKLYPFQVELHGGKASGSEIVSSAIGGFNTFQKSKDGMKFASIGKLPCAVVVADTKISVPTSMTVGYHVPSLIERNRERVMSIFEEIGGLTENAKKAIKEKDIEKIGLLMNENQKLLSSLGLSHPKIDDCISEALNAGALGAKFSGKGWGGVMFALCRKEDQERVAKAMARTKADIMVTEIGVSGVKI